MRITTRILIIFIITIFIYNFSNAASITGEIIDNESNQTLLGANITIPEIDRGTISNKKGEFKLENIPSGQYKMIISYIGYQQEILTLTLSEDETKALKIALNPAVIPTQGIIISSKRYEKALDEIAMPVSVVSSEQLKNSPALTLSDALRNEPGLSLGRDGIWGTRLVVRGLSKSNLVTLVDGNRIDTAPDLAASTSMIDLGDIERMEVIRGAASSLYGSGAVGGVINIITRKGYYSDDFQFSGAFQGGYGSVNNLGSGHLRLSAQSTHWNAYLSAMQRTADNVQTPNGELLNSQFRDKNLAAKFGIRPFTNHEIKFNYQNFRANDVGIPGGSDLFPGNAEVRYPVEKREMFSTEIVNRFPHTALRQTSLKYFMQNIQREVENIPNMVKSVPGTPPKRVHVLKVTPGADHETDGIQFQSNWLFANRHFVIAGIDYWKKQYRGHRSKFQKIEILDPESNNVVKTIQKEIGELPLPDSEYGSYGFFFQDEVNLFDNLLSVTIGGRYDKIEIKSEPALNPLFEVTNGVRNDTPSNQVVLWPAQTENNHSWSSNLNFLYRMTSQLNMTLSVAKSFRSPSLEERFAYIDLGNLVKIGDPALAAEKGFFIDLGTRYQSQSLVFSGNIFLNELTDLVVEAPFMYEERAALKATNVGKARLLGFDGQIDWRVWTKGTAYGTIAYVRGEDLNNNSPLPLIPPLNGRLGLRWKAGSLFEIDFSSHLFADQERIVAGEIRTPGYVIFDVFCSTKKLSWDLLSNEITIGIGNLFDRAYRNHLATNRGLVVAEPGRNISVRWLMEF